MAFPEIDASRPLGTQMVSTIDNAERETRLWLQRCMETISGYPYVDTVGVKSWTSSTRPTFNPNDNLLLGYNTTTNSLELIGGEGDVIEVLSNNTKKSIALLAHPVGEYYWTSNASFNPNTAWGGTWERIQDGRVLISNDSSHAVGSTGGASTVTLTLNQIPSHSHPHTHKHRHDYGDMNITGTFPLPSEARFDANNHFSGAFTKGETTTGSWSSDANKMGSLLIDFNASGFWTGNMGYDNTAASAHAQGGGQSHNNMPPYRTAICWHRTA